MSGKDEILTHVSTNLYVITVAELGGARESYRFEKDARRQREDKEDAERGPTWDRDIFYTKRLFNPSRMDVMSKNGEYYMPPTRLDLCLPTYCVGGLVTLLRTLCIHRGER